MYLAVQAVCDAKPAVWRRSPAFTEAYAEFCQCLQKLLEFQSALDVFQSVAKGIAVEMTVADTILTTEMDELIEHFEAIDVVFVDDYTAARSMEIAEDQLTVPSPMTMI